MSRINTSLHGRLLGLDFISRLLVPNGLRLGDHGSQFDVDSPGFASITDDFLGAAISNAWGVNKGSDAATVNFAALASALSGKVRATTGAGAGASMAVNGVQINAGLNYQANSGHLVMEAKLNISAITNISLFVGFTNQTASLQAPINASGAGDGLTANAADAVGFLFDTAMTTKNLWAVGVANSVVATGVNSAKAPVAGTDIKLRVEVDKSGNALFYINGKEVGNARVSGAVRATVPLTPVVTAFTRSAASANVDIDYLHASAARV